MSAVSTELGVEHLTWSTLPRPAKLYRAAHATWAIVSLASLAVVWRGAIDGRRDRVLAASIAWLGVEGVALVIGRGNCPLGPVQARLGDPVPLFELALPPRAAKAAVPILAVVSGVGILLAAVRWMHDIVASHGSKRAIE